MFGDLENYYDDEETLELLRRYKEMIDNKHHDFFDLYEFENLINYYTEQYNFKDALKVIAVAIKQHPTSTTLKLRHAQLLIESFKPARALRILKSIMHEEASNTELHLAMGIAYNMIGKFANARQSFNRTLKYCNDLKDEVAYNIAQSFMQLNLLNEAVKYLLLAHYYNNSNILVLYDLGMCYERLGNNEKAAVWYNKYLDLDPFAEHVWNNLGIIYSALGNFRQAEEAFDFSISLNPQFIPAYFYKADLYINNGKIQEAIDVYNDLIVEDTSNTRAMCNLANCHIQTGNYQEALKLFRNSLEISCDCADALYGTGVVYFRQKKFSLSINQLKKAISIQPDISDYWVMLGEVYFRTRRLNKAIDAFSKASELNPDDMEAKFSCAQALFKKKRIHEAIWLLMRIYEKQPDNPRVNYRLAAYYVYQQNLFEAQKYLKRALFLDYREHVEMFRHYPKTKTVPSFRSIIDNFGQKTDMLLKIRK